MSAIIVYPSTVTDITATTGSTVAAGPASSISSAAGAGSSSAAAGAAAGGGGGQGQSEGMDTDELIAFWLDIGLLWLEDSLV